MARIDLRQLDEFVTTFLDDVVEGDVPAWDDTLKQFVPVTLVSFRRNFLLMGA